MSVSVSHIRKYFLSSIVWLLGIYIILFSMCFYAHVNESNIIANRADGLLMGLANGDKSNLIKIASVQTMVRKKRPIFFEPYTVIDSLFGKREPFNAANRLLRDVVEENKTELANLSLEKVILSDADLDDGDFHGSNLRKANLRFANLERANLVGTNFEFSDLYGARFSNAKVYRANFRGSILKGADLRSVVGITCAQILSALIDKDTLFPRYISFSGAKEADLKCVNLLKGEGVDFNGISLENIYLPGSDFSKSNLSHVNFLNAVLKHSNFSSANLSKASLKGANLERTVFHEANLKEADLRGANLNQATSISCEQIKSAVIDENTRFPDNILLAGSLDSAYKCENTLK